MPRVEDDEIAAAVNGIDGTENPAAGEVFDGTPADILPRTKAGKIGGRSSAFLSKKIIGTR